MFAHRPHVFPQVAAAVAQSRLHPDSTGIDTQHPHTPAFVDAPVSGGVPGAAAGTLTFMVAFVNVLCCCCYNFNMVVFVFVVAPKVCVCKCAHT